MSVLAAKQSRSRSPRSALALAARAGSAPAAAARRLGDAAGGHDLAAQGDARRLADDADQLPRRAGRRPLADHRARLAQRRATAASSSPTATGTGASFVPPRAVHAGETVTVTRDSRRSRASAGRSARPSRSARCTRSRRRRRRRRRPTRPVAAPPGTVASLALAADPPSADGRRHHAGGRSGARRHLPDPRRRPVAGRGDDRQPGGPAGLVRARRRPAQQAADLRVQQYLGQPVLTYWQGRIALGHGARRRAIIDEHDLPRRSRTVNAGNGLAMDLHDFDLEPDGVGADHRLRAGLHGI